MPTAVRQRDAALFSTGKEAGQAGPRRRAGTPDNANGVTSQRYAPMQILVRRHRNFGGNPAENLPCRAGGRRSRRRYTGVDHGCIPATSIFQLDPSDVILATRLGEVRAGRVARDSRPFLAPKMPPACDLRAGPSDGSTRQRRRLHGARPSTGRNECLPERGSAF